MLNEIDNIEKSQCCCFTGHRKIAYDELPELKIRLAKAILEMYQKGVRNFYTGGATGFDTLAAEYVLNLKYTYPDIRLILVLPCLNQADYYSEKDKARYDYTLENADKVVYVQHKYTKLCMQKRNRALVDNASFCISYVNKDSGGSYHTKAYAKFQNLEIHELAK